MCLRRIKNNLNPAWTETFEATYEFGKESKINVGIFDEVRKSGKAISMGSATFDIGEILAARGSIKAKKLRNGGTVFVRVTRAAASNGGIVRGQIRGVKLKNVDGIFRKSDPFFIINSQMNDPAGLTWQPVYRSETVMNNLNPSWKSFALSLDKICGGNKDLPLLIEVLDWEKSGKHQAMGAVQTTVNSLLFQMGGADKKLQLVHKKKSFGFIQLDSFSVSEEGTSAASVAAAAGNNTASGPPKKFIKVNGISKINPEYKKWKDAQAVPAPTPTSAAAIPPPVLATNNHPPASAPIPPPMAPPDIGNRAALANEKPRFVDYIAGGTEISLAVAIDYTGSNGDPRKPGTLHYIHRDRQLNDYEKALTAVGSIVARYDSDQMFPVWGFGAKYGGVIQHCFQVGRAAELHGIGEIVQAYRGVFSTGLTMSGPTVFAEVIDCAAAQARAKQEANAAVGEQSYTILLILTDGAVTDIEQTKRSIRNASDAPLSIVIVGIGSADFSAMQFLDDFQKQEGGRTRDIVQFVEFSRHKYDKEALTRETLDEIPDQLVDYFHGNGIMPLPPSSGSKLNINVDAYNADEDIDLAMSINSEGEINLSNPSEAIWDAHSYGNASKFLTPASNAYPQPMPPPSTAGGAYAPAGGAYAPAGGAYAPAGGAIPYAATATPVTAVPLTPVQIQAPANSYPGMQLQVQHPVTGQSQIIAVPPGVAPGARFTIQM